MNKAWSALLAATLFAVTASLAAAETDAQWKANAFNKISKCRALWIPLGDVPTDRNAMTRDTTFVCHTRYALSHDNVTRTPDWVLEKITKAQISGVNDRPDKSFTGDKRVPPRGRAVNTDYPPKAVGFARGHMAPSEDFNSSVTAMKNTFVLSNAVPQIASFNGGVWGQLENRVRDVAFARKDIRVITGPVRRQGDSRNVTLTAAQAGCGKEIKIQGPQIPLVCKANNLNPEVTCKTSVAVPIALYKIVYDPKAGETGKGGKVYAFLLPNREHRDTGDDTKAYLDGFRVTVAAIEDLTGMQFFRQLPAEKQDRLRKQCEANTFWVEPRPPKKKKKKPA